KAATETHELQAVAAAMPGVDTGLVGFEDVTGEVSRVVDEPGPSWLSGDLPARIGSALVLVALLFGSLWAGGGWFVALVTVVSVLALGEFYSSIRRVGYVPVALFGLLGAVAVMISAWVAGPGGIAGALTVFTMVILLWFSVLVRRNPLENATLTIFGLIWIAGLLGYAAALARFDSFRPLILALVLVAAFFDIGSYFVGRSMGSRQLAPMLSPKKTVEGLIGGALVAVAVAVLLSFLTWFDPITLNGGLLLAAGVVAVAPLGDLAESMIKRSLGIKDMGSLLPGHGGLLDRIDALLFAVPVGYLIYQALGYLG
ncbi:MAG: phosphatidate cytidylyltransferase, partial [Acidimicrobiia bacterium]|nr:phosphatidate cytidylyltransferase [Acidimicrobiia bacterium]